MNLKEKSAQARAEAHEPAPGPLERLPKPQCLCRGVLSSVVALLFLASVHCFGTEPVENNPTLPELLQKVHDLYLDEYPLFAEAFSRVVKLPVKTAYGEELTTNVNLCKPYEQMIVEYSARLVGKIAPLSSNREEQKKTINELIWLDQQMADTNRFLADVLLKLSFETGLDWRYKFNKLQSESVFYQELLGARIAQLISSTF